MWPRRQGAPAAHGDLLVPRAASLAAVTEYLTHDQVVGVDFLITAGSAMVAVTFGVLLGLAAGSIAGLTSGVSLTTRISSGADEVAAPPQTRSSGGGDTRRSAGP